jgi:hypothetical protein
VFEDESGVSLLPSVRATWAPRGHTPVLRHRFGFTVTTPEPFDAELITPFPLEDSPEQQTAIA